MLDYKFKLKNTDEFSKNTIYYLWIKYIQPKKKKEKENVDRMTIS